MIELAVITGNMEAAIDNLRQYRDYDVIVSRGGTAQLLRENLASPVIEVEVSVYDMLRTIKMAQQTGKRFAIMGFPSMTRASKTVCDILQYDMPSSTIHSAEDTAPAMRALLEQGVELVIGDVITTDIARKAGIDSLLITSGFESVEKAFEETVQLYQNIERIQRAAPYKEILARSPRPIALFGSDRQSAYMNPAYIAQMPKELEPVLKECIGRLVHRRK